MFQFICCYKVNYSRTCFGASNFLAIYNDDVGVSTFFPEYETTKRHLPMKSETDDFDA